MCTFFNVPNISILIITQNISVKQDSCAAVTMSQPFTLSNFKNISLTSQTMTVSQAPPPPPLFSQGFNAIECVEAPLCSQSDLPLCTPDYITPADQFNLEYDPNDKELKQQRSPAQLSPSRIKRPRHMHPPSQDDVSQPTAVSRHQNHHNSYFPTGGRRVVARVQSPPCYRSIFRNEEEGDEGLASFRVLRKAASNNAPPLSRYRSDFREIGLLGSGHYSKVLRGRHRLDGRDYAIKRSQREVAPDSVAFAQFIQEIQVLAHLPSHPNICHYYTAWTEPGTQGGEMLYMQLEKCDVTLEVHASLIGRAPKEKDLIEILRQMASALAHVHAHGVAHMDIKPDNILLVEPECCFPGELEEKRPWSVDGTVYKLGDFGQATRLDTTGLGVTEGDSRYLPLEVMNSNYKCLDKADMFALGATMLQLASGNPLPQSGPAYQDLRSGKLPLLPTVTASFARMIKLLMSPAPEDRPTALQVLKSTLFS